LKTVIAFLFLFIGYSGFSQTDLNEYKYIIVPKKFESFKNLNEYQTSTLIKYLFAGKGFNPVYDDALPNELNSNRCLGLLANLQDDSNLFTTKTIIVLKDCNGNEVFKTTQGLSKEKEYIAAYNEAIKESMRSFNGFNYAYNQKMEPQEPITVSFKNDVKKLDEQQSDKTASVELKEKKVNKVANPAVTQEATETIQYYKDITPVDSQVEKVKLEKPAFKKLEIKKPNPTEIWYAQATENGYQLVDSTPKIRMKLLKSSADNVFMAQADTTNGMVYQMDGNWIFEYYEEDELVQEQLNIKF
jgi:hypothetical protein